MNTAIDESNRNSVEIDKLRAETRLIHAQNKKMQAELEGKMQMEVAKLIAEIGKTNAESRKLTKEASWYPLVIGGGLFAGAGAAALGLVKLYELLKL